MTGLVQEVYSIEIVESLGIRAAKTLKRLVELADEVVAAAGRGRDPHLEIPARALSNVRYNKAKRFIGRKFTETESERATVPYKVEAGKDGLI